jgi:hypothetical protein
VARRLHVRFPDLRVLYISEERRGELHIHHELPPDAPFLQKPCAAEELCRKVEELLGAKTVGLVRQRTWRPVLWITWE